MSQVASSPQLLAECNYNVYVLYDSSEFGLEVISRDDMDALITYKGLWFPELPKVKEGEALALLEAMA